MLEKFVPQLHVDTVYDIDLAALQRTGVRGVITDLDNTLVGAREALATPELIVWLEKVETAGFQIVIVSNNSQVRVTTFAKPLKLPFIHRAQKPKFTAFKQALQLMGLGADEVVVVGDQMLTDVFGGNRMGLYTILVRAISLEDEGFFTKINRRIEKLLLARLKRKGHTLWEDQS